MSRDRNMTWNDLLHFLSNNKDILQDTVTVYDKSKGEFYPSDTIEFIEGDDILDPGSMFIQIET